VGQDTVFDHFLMKAEDSGAVVEKRPDWDRMAASGLDSNYSVLLASSLWVHWCLLRRLAYIPEKRLGIRVVVAEGAAVEYLPAVHMFVRPWFESCVEAISQEVPQLSSLSATSLVEGLHQIYSKRQHLVDCWRHDHARSARHRSASLADNQPLYLVAIDILCQQISSHF
jgi:hypothetical protein